MWPHIKRDSKAMSWREKAYVDKRGEPRMLVMNEDEKTLSSFHGRFIVFFLHS